ncbi:MAG: hypothetical protein DI529_15175 [Chryseobacterium sp.]|nr:MAG: hypothetical protein DI529_15175 [Chryseobacterium sp.]
MKFKYFLFFTLCFSIVLFSSQKKISIIDFETKQIIPQVRVIYNNEISYTNDDGFVMIPNEVKNIELFAPQYEQGVFPVNSSIELKPIYKEIQEVVIKTVDAKKIINSVLKDYDKNYEIKTSIYNGTFKTKSEIDNKLNRILVLDMDLWTLNNKYDYRKDIDQFMQVNLRNKKFDKNKKDDKNYIFNKKRNISPQEDKIKSFLQRFFLYNQLYIMDYYTKGLKINGTIINETRDVQTIKFKSDNMPDNILYYEGIMQYNKKENTISYIEVNHVQKKTEDKYLNIFDKEITVNTNLYTVTYDMFKKGEKYVPAKIMMKYEAGISLENKIYSAISIEEFIFNKHNFADKKGLSKKIDLSKSFLDNITDNSLKDSKTLLSTEEKKFVDEP